MLFRLYMAHLGGLRSIYRTIAKGVREAEEADKK
jgi:hypothetical protein